MHAGNIFKNNNTPNSSTTYKPPNINPIFNTAQNNSPNNNILNNPGTNVNNIFSQNTSNFPKNPGNIFSNVTSTNATQNKPVSFTNQFIQNANQEKPIWGNVSGNNQGAIGSTNNASNNNSFKNIGPTNAFNSNIIPSNIIGNNNQPQQNPIGQNNQRPFINFTNKDNNNQTKSNFEDIFRNTPFSNSQTTNNQNPKMVGNIFAQNNNNQNTQNSNNNGNNVFKLVGNQVGNNIGTNIFNQTNTNSNFNNQQNDLQFFQNTVQNNYQQGLNNNQMFMNQQINSNQHLNPSFIYNGYGNAPINQQNYNINNGPLSLQDFSQQIYNEISNQPSNYHHFQILQQQQGFTLEQNKILLKYFKDQILNINFTNFISPNNKYNKEKVVNLPIKKQIMLLRSNFQKLKRFIAQIKNKNAEIELLSQNFQTAIIKKLKIDKQNVLSKIKESQMISELVKQVQSLDRQTNNFFFPILNHNNQEVSFNDPDLFCLNVSKQVLQKLRFVNQNLNDYINIHSDEPADQQTKATAIQNLLDYYHIVSNEMRAFCQKYKQFKKQIIEKRFKCTYEDVCRKISDKVKESQSVHQQCLDAIELIDNILQRRMCFNKPQGQTTNIEAKI